LNPDSGALSHVILGEAFFAESEDLGEPRRVARLY